MRRLFLSVLAALVLVVLLLGAAPSEATERHPAVRRAMAALEAAKTDLQNAAHDYCGHRVQALEATNAAINQLQQALQCDSRRDDSSGAELDAEPVTAGARAAERHPNIYKAINALGAAEGDLQNAAHDYCGHRVQALESTRSALGQLKSAIQCDKR